MTPRPASLQHYCQEIAKNPPQEITPNDAIQDQGIEKIRGRF